MRRVVSGILLIITTSGCAMYPESHQENSSTSHVRHTQTPASGTVSGHHPTVENASSQPPPREPSNSGVASLLQQAAQARAAGDLSRAQSLAERAQALEPRQGYSYLELARIYQAKGDTNRARQMALRGQSYAGGDPSLKMSLQQFSNP